MAQGQRTLLADQPCGARIINAVMRFSQLFGRTLREDPADVDSASARLLLRGGLVDQLAAGVYTLLPLGFRVYHRLEGIVRDELQAAGAQEVLMPVLSPLELWQRSGRDAAYGDELFRLDDRRSRRFALGPTHEEVVTSLVAARVRSHRDLPVTLFQIQTKFRDEPRPRAGLIRLREFTMADAYSFDAGEAAVDASYDAMFTAFQNVFTRCGLATTPVEADSGAIGGKESVEFMLPAESGEGVMVRCIACGYVANEEKAGFGRVPYSSTTTAPAALAVQATPHASDSPDTSKVFARGVAGATEANGGVSAAGAASGTDAAGTPVASVPPPMLPMEPVSTPGVKTIDELATFLSIPTQQTLKAVFYLAQTGAQRDIVIVGIRGDIAVNEVKLANLLHCNQLRLANDAEVSAAGLVAGSASPVGISGLRTVVDESVPLERNLVAGGNQADVHLKNVNYGRDFTATLVADIAVARPGDPCPRCAAPLAIQRGIELGHVFKLGTRYSEAFSARYLDAEGHQQTIWMGCYGIGVSRLLAAVVEAHHDQQGIVWPASLAPFQVHIVALNADDPQVAEASGALYAALGAAGIETLLDDRTESAGVKFNDADLIGVPLRVTVGPRGLRRGEVEIKRRATGEVESTAVADAASRLLALVAGLLASPAEA